LIRLFFAACVLAGGALVPAWQSQPPFDLVILNARIVDGTGAPARAGDVAIRDGLVARIGRVPPAEARERLDGTGLVLAPGFIDVQTHADDILAHPLAENFIRMGVTSVVAGSCGTSVLPVGDTLDRVQDYATAVNFATLVGHTTVRKLVIGNVDRDPSIIELKRMQVLVFKAMAEGAVGYSTDPEHVPGSFAKPNEVIEVARIAANEGGVYLAHLRDSGAGIEAAVAESIRNARRVDMPLVIAHLKVDGPGNWGKSMAVLQLIDEARKAGRDVQGTVFPYATDATSLASLFPESIRIRGDASLRATLGDAAEWARVKIEMQSLLEAQGFADLSWVTIARYDLNPGFEGLSMPEVAERMIGDRTADHQLEAARVLVMNGGASIVDRAGSDDDVERFLRYPFVSIASDAGLPESEGPSHPRAYGTTARVLGEFVRERGVLTLEEAVRKMTSLPAAQFGLAGRGVIREGAPADLVLFDAARVHDVATYASPRAFPAGIPHVLVNGVFVVRDGRTIGARPGTVLSVSRKWAPTGLVREPK
jgi:N-acyl-D-amino-acid deacylase